MQKPAAGKSLYCQCGKSVSTVLIMVSLWYNLWHCGFFFRNKERKHNVIRQIYKLTRLFKWASNLNISSM